MVYDCASPDSLRQLEEKFVAEVQVHCPEAPFIFCGSKSDVFEDEDWLSQLEAEGRAVVSEAEGVAAAMRCGARGHMQYSCKNMHNLREVMQMAIAVALLKQARKLDSKVMKKSRRGNCPVQ
jgi:Ras homolog gene family, member A